MSEKRLVVFDLDGTLNRTDLFGVPAHQQTLHELGITNVTDEEIISTFGARDVDYAPGLIGTDDRAQVDAYNLRVAECELDFIQKKAGSFEGIPEMLRKLKQDGHLTAVCSNATEAYIRMVLEALHIIDDIDFIQPLMEGLEKDDTLRLLLGRVHPDAAVMVGDRIFDENAAKANRLPFIGCLYGYKPGEVQNADVPVKRPCEINDAVKELIG